MNKSKFLHDFGPWALVTGASSGIGREFVDQLAALGFNLVLVSRNEGKLEEIAGELQATSDIMIEVVAVDLSDPDFLEVLGPAVAKLDIGLVVSNAGADHMGALLRIPLEKLTSMLRLNAESHLKIAHHFGWQFLERRKKGGLLFVSSTASLQATPLLANYAGAKAYVRTLGSALNYELKGRGIHSTVLVPGPTSTPAFHERTDIDLNTMPMPPMKVAPVVTAGLDGLAKNRPTVIPGFMNKAMDFMGRKIMSRSMAKGMWGMLMNRSAPNSLKF